jgi:hypothetical protein
MDDSALMFSYKGHLRRAGRWKRTMRHLIYFVVLIWMLSGICLADSEMLLTRVSLDQATHQIIKEQKIRVLGAQTEIVDGKEVHVIKVLTSDGHIRHYRIDAETGNPIH